MLLSALQFCHSKCMRAGRVSITGSRLEMPNLSPHPTPDPLAQQLNKELGDTVLSSLSSTA